MTKEHLAFLIIQALNGTKYAYDETFAAALEYVLGHQLEVVTPELKAEALALAKKGFAEFCEVHP